MKNIPPLMFAVGMVSLLVIPVQAGPPEAALSGVLNASYIIENREVHLIGGRAEVQAAPGSAAKITTVVFGEPVFGDLDGEGREDAALFLAHDSGGSGTFYYVAAAILKNRVYQGTNAVLLGDRIAPRTIHIRNGIIVVHYYGRRPDEPMAAQPSIIKAMYLSLKEGRLETIKAPW